MKSKYRFINYELKLTLEFKLATNSSKGIYYNLIIEVLDTILSKPKGEFGHIVYNSDLTQNCSASINVIKRHIRWLLVNNILLKRDGSRTDIKMGFHAKSNNPIYKLNPHQYKLSNSMELDSLRMFVYKSLHNVITDDIEKNKNKLKYVSLKESPNRFNNNLLALQTGLDKVSIDIENALKELYYSDSQDKIAQAKNCYKIALNDNDNICYGTQVNRVYSNITSISSLIHKYLYIDGYKINEIDARASQITLISLLTRNYDSELHKIVDSNNPDSFYNSLIRYVKHNYESVTVIRNFTDEYGHTKKIRLSKDPFNIYLTKSDIKGDVYSAIFSGFTNNSTVSNVIKELYGDVINPLMDMVGTRVEFKPINSKITYINNSKFVPLKIKLKSNLAKYLQDLESSIFVDTAIKMNELGYYCITKHDSIMMNNSQYDIFLDEIINKYKEVGLLDVLPIHFKPKLSIDDNLFKFEQQDVEVEIIDELDKSEISKSIGNTNMAIYKFRNDKLKLEFAGIKSEFINKYKLNRGSIDKLIKGKIKSSKGWKCIYNI